MFRSSRDARVREESGSGGTKSAQTPPSGSSPSPGYPASAPSPPWGPAPQTAGTGTGPDDGLVEPGHATEETGKKKPSLTGSVYAGIAVLLIILIVVIDFILQNLNKADIHLFWTSFNLPIGIMVLLGAIGGAIIVLLISLGLHFRDLRRAHQQRNEEKRLSQQK